MKVLLSIVLGVCVVTGCGKTEPSTADKTAPTSGSASSVAPPARSPSAPAATANEPPADDRCELVVEGDITDRGFGRGGNAAVASDYWMNDAEIRKALEVMAKVTKSKDRDIDADMKKDPRIMTLVLNCQTPRTKLSFLPSDGSKYADVPFGPKKYKIADGRTDKSPGVMRTLVTFQKDTGVWNLDGVGELDITKFDQTGIAGSFAFAMTERQFGASTTPARKVKVSGTFAFKCTPGTANCK